MNFIYALTCPVEGAVRYVGKTANPGKRLHHHITSARSGRTKHHAAQWMRKLLADGKQPTLHVLCRLPDDANWQAVERLLIGFCKDAGLPLTNVTIGGEGVSFTDPESRQRQVAGRRRTMEAPEVRAKWSQSLKAANSRPEVLLKRRESAFRAASDPAHVARHAIAVNAPHELARKSAASKAVWSRPTYAAKIRERAREALKAPGAMERFQSRNKEPEVVAKRIKAVKVAHARPETKARVAKANKEIGARPDVKAKKSASTKASWADDDKRFAREVGMAAAKPAMSAARKAAWSDPKKAAEMKAAQRAAWADPVKKEAALASRRAKWADPVQRAAMIEKQKLAWEKRRAK